MVKVMDNFLDKEEFDNVSNMIMADNFSWYYSDKVTDKNDSENNYYFTHMFYNKHEITSNHFYLLNNLLNKINCKSIIRIKANLYSNQNKKQIHKAHTDYSFSHKGCLFYINDNNGLTYFENESVEPKANRAVFFDPSKKHSSSLCTDKNRRININFNYF